MVSRVYMICDSYESGYGHGLQNDGLDLSKTPHTDPELGEAYQLGYEAGRKRRLELESLDLISPDAAEDICGLCGLPGADKIPHPVHWPDERIPSTDLVHAECEAEECARASALCQGKARDAFLRNCR